MADDDKKKPESKPKIPVLIPSEPVKRGIDPDVIKPKRN